MISFKELRISQFGKFKDTVFKFNPGINVISGKNEAGKSTVLEPSLDLNKTETDIVHGQIR